MQTNNYKCFPILITQIQNFLSADECQQLVNVIDQNDYAPHGALTGPALSTFNNAKDNIINDFDKIIPLKERISQALDTYTKETGLTKVKLDNSWVNVQHQDSRLNFHTHPCSALSGALYLKVDQDSSKLCLINPNALANNYATIELTEYTYEWVNIVPKIGDLIIFPSLIKHGSNEINQSMERIVCSFNTNYA